MKLTNRQFGRYKPDGHTRRAGRGLPIKREEKEEKKEKEPWIQPRSKKESLSLAKRKSKGNTREVTTRKQAPRHFTGIKPRTGGALSNGKCGELQENGTNQGSHHIQ